jgi:hypothetical protein
VLKSVFTRSRRHAAVQFIGAAAVVVGVYLLFGIPIALILGGVVAATASIHLERNA